MKILLIDFLLIGKVLVKKNTSHFFAFFILLITELAFSSTCRYLLFQENQGIVFFNVPPNTRYFTKSVSVSDILAGSMKYAGFNQLYMYLSGRIINIPEGPILEVGPYLNPIGHNLTIQRNPLIVWDLDTYSLTEIYRDYTHINPVKIAVDLNELDKYSTERLFNRSLKEANSSSKRFSSIILSSVLNYIDAQKWVNEFLDKLEENGILFLSNSPGEGTKIDMNPFNPETYEEQSQYIRKILIERAQDFELDSDSKPESGLFIIRKKQGDRQKRIEELQTKIPTIPKESKEKLKSEAQESDLIPAEERVKKSLNQILNSTPVLFGPFGHFAQPIRFSLRKLDIKEVEKALDLDKDAEILTSTIINSYYVRAKFENAGIMVRKKRDYVLTQFPKWKTEYDNPYKAVLNSISNNKLIELFDSPIFDFRHWIILEKIVRTLALPEILEEIVNYIPLEFVLELEIAKKDINIPNFRAGPGRDFKVSLELPWDRIVSTRYIVEFNKRLRTNDSRVNVQVYEAMLKAGFNSSFSKPYYFLRMALNADKWQTSFLTDFIFKNQKNGKLDRTTSDILLEVLKQPLTERKEFAFNYLKVLHESNDARFRDRYYHQIIFEDFF